MERSMKHMIRTGVVALAALGLSWGPHGAAIAGGSMLDEGENHAYYFGSIKDTNGAAVVNAKVKIQTKALTLMTQSDVLGAYKLPIIGREIHADDLIFSCSKDGYRQADVIRRSGPGGDGKEPVEIDCTLQRE
jgi:hypothetical protein